MNRCPDPKTGVAYTEAEWLDMLAGTSRPIYPLLAADGAVRGSDWTGGVTWTTGGTAIIRGNGPNEAKNRDGVVSDDD